MAKYRYNTISRMRTFEETPAKRFLVEGLKQKSVPRSELERLEYRELANLIKRGQIKAIQRIG